MVCGDGTTASAEQCDDGNTTSGDGCSATCTTETPPGSCGDGAVASTEACDDGNTMAADGCTACTIDTGYTCTGMPSTCVTDVPTASGTCTSPFDLVLTNNMGTLEGAGSGDTTTGTDQVAEAMCDGFASGAGPDHVWRFTLTDTRDVVILTDDTSAFDTVLRVLAAPCDVTTEISEYGTEDGCSDGEGASEFLGYVSLPAGTYYIVIDGYTATDLGAYSFTVLALPPTCGDGVSDPLEFCDDGNTTANDGCDAKCEVEDGYVCDAAEPSVCVPEQPLPGNAMPPAAGDLKINELMAADNMSDTNCDLKTTGTDDEFIELVNVSNKLLDLTGVTISDSITLRHTFQAVTLPAGQAIVVWSAGAPACANVTRFAVASEGQLGLNDAGDTVTVRGAGATPPTLLTMTYASGTPNVSLNLSPDVTGTAYVLHNTLGGAVGAFSPGRRANNTAF